MRTASGGLVLLVGLSLSACGGGGSGPEVAPAAVASAIPAAAGAQQVEVVADLFKRRRAQLEAVALDCLGGRVASVISDRLPDPAATPLLNPDAATDGLASVAAGAVAEHTRAMNRSWNAADPPRPVYLFPRPPAQSGRAVVRFETSPDVAVAAFVVTRDVPRGPWHVESSYWCSQ